MHGQQYIKIFSKDPQISSLITIQPMGAELFHVDRRTDGRAERHDEANSHFSRFFELA
jgi:hypothetical protein